MTSIQLRYEGSDRSTGRAFGFEARGRSLATNGDDEFTELGLDQTVKLNPPLKRTGGTVSDTTHRARDARTNRVDLCVTVVGRLAIPIAASLRQKC